MAPGVEIAVEADEARLLAGYRVGTLSSVPVRVRLEYNTSTRLGSGVTVRLTYGIPGFHEALDTL
jgi:hypothetical protein